jgi:hypothetical protein
MSPDPNVVLAACDASFDTHKACLHHEDEGGTKQNPNLIDFTHEKRHSLDFSRGLVPIGVFQQHFTLRQPRRICRVMSTYSAKAGQFALAMSFLLRNG